MELRKVLLMSDFDLFDFDYPCDDPAWKADLEAKIIDYYYFDEIGQETIDRFKHRFRTKMQSIMGYYNDLYKTTALNLSPLTTVSIDETITSSGDSAVKQSDYPQTQNPNTDILSNMQSMQSGSTSTRHLTGYQGSYPDLLKAHRETILRINGAIIKELKSCFILVY